MPKNEVEALLFSAGKNMTVDAIASLVGTDKRTVIEDLKKLQQEYNARDSALMIVDEGEEWKIHVREKFLPLVQKIVADTELPKTVLETLAVIAYKSPVLQSDVINIRTSTAYEHIGLLIDMGFVTREKSGRSFLLRVTDKFFDYFDIAGDKTMQEIFKNVKKRAPLKAEEDKEEQAKEDAQSTLMDIPKVEIVDEEQTGETVAPLPIAVKKEPVGDHGKVLDLDDSGTFDPDRNKDEAEERVERIKPEVKQAKQESNRDAKATSKAKPDVRPDPKQDSKVSPTDKTAPSENKAPADNKTAPAEKKPITDAKAAPESKKADAKADVKKIEEEEHNVEDMLDKVESDIERITTKKKKFQEDVKKKISSR